VNATTRPAGLGSLVRIGFVLFGLVGAGEIAYASAWVVMPKDA
jgi:phage shock protein PspC (stress-responsive transcriptional regulator)